MEIRVKELSKSFEGFYALKNVSTVIPSGRKTALIGPNGSGKSTLTRILMGMLTYEGSVLLDGSSPSQKRVAIAERLAYVPQSPPQLAAAVGDLTRAVAQLRDRPLEDFIAAAHRLDLDIESAFHRPVKSLSAGMKQKLLIALAFAARPELLILDEPTASLDPTARAHFYEYFQEIAVRATLILCSHRVEEIQHLVDHVILLEAGEVVFDGPITEFLQGRMTTSIEVGVRDSSSAEALEKLGLVKTGLRLWSKVVASHEKLVAARTIFQELNGQMTHLNIRDMDVVSMRDSEEKS